MADWWGSMPGFEKLFWLFAVPFTVIFIFQQIMMFLGVGDDTSDMVSDADTLESSDDSTLRSVFKVLSIKNVITFFTIFGWSGITIHNAGVGKIITVIASIVIAFIITIIVSMLFYSILRLTESGNLELKDAVGHIGKVYVPIPADESGIGKVHLTFNGAFREIDAVTPGEALPTGTEVLVIKFRDDDTFVVTKPNMKGW
ncbi:hypothetical protein RBH29_01960 [Herbivorax sp. ANBcel31]|uniref:hypothetical protein n=1 Tax=Herbivorax sp. ANBcel31 TaxID=3069754 RepID=UPI0027B8402C|nr:hypothetical protein [Herbivorax sp. ANBcel31]MDQ2085200.1 hypothetical protein [Herbivorax sp. ANBcel31]